MASVTEHYDKVLSDIYSWMLGGFESATQRYTEFIETHSLQPKGSRTAIDLGSGCGLQAIPLAKAGYSVTAIDIDRKLLAELKSNSTNLSINAINDDLLNFDNHAEENIELIICMTDTILHLDSKEKVSQLFSKVYKQLEPKGKFVITFRDLTFELKELDRFMPVKSDDDKIFTCFLEYEKETVKVHDILYKKVDGNWELSKSFYRKLRLSKDWVDNRLRNSGFKKINSNIKNGLVTIIAEK